MSDFRYRNPSAPRLAFAGFLAVTALVLLSFGLRLSSGYGSYRAEIAQAERLIDRAEAATPATGPGGGLYYIAQTPRAAQTQLQSDMQEIADRHALSVEVMQPGEIETMGDLLRVPLTLNGAIPEATLGQFFADLTSRKPVLIVEEYGVRRLRGVRPGAGPREVSLSLKVFAMTAR